MPSSLHKKLIIFPTVPSAPPLDIRCDSRNSQGLSVSWQPPPHYGQNGIIQGYKVQYENMKEQPLGKFCFDRISREEQFH
jgi:hypothetical protein